MAVRGYVFVHYDCEIVENTQDGVRFGCPNPIPVRVCSSMTISKLQEKILQKLRQQNKQIIQILYQLPLMVGQGTLCFTSCLIQTDDDIGMMFDCHARFPDLSVMEISIALGDLNISFGGSAADPTYVGQTLVMSNAIQNENFMPGNENDLGHSFEMNVGSNLGQTESNPSYDDIFEDEDSEEDLNEELFEDEIDEEIVPLTQGQRLTTQTQTQSESHRIGHYSSLNFEAIQVNQLDNSDIMGLHGVNQLHERQQFPNKEFVQLAVKNYSIRNTKKSLNSQSISVGFII